jgi:Purple acid Phosphatase, N-terminal domain
MLPRSLSLLALAPAALLAQPPADPCVTGQIRISIGIATNSMVVSWATNAGLTPPTYAPVVKYGLTPTTLTNVATPSPPRNYTLCELPSPLLHMATMTSLTPGATYYYTISDAHCGTNGPVQFSAQPTIGAKTYPFTVYT